MFFNLVNTTSLSSSSQCLLPLCPPPPPKSSLVEVSLLTCSCSSSSSSCSIDKTLSKIQTSGVIACLRAKSAEQAMEAASAALNGGISVLEIVVSTPGVFEVLPALVKSHPAAVLGVGTVLNLKDAKSAIKAGARFLMSPATVKEIMDDVISGEVLYIPGAMTPTEIMSAHNLGAKIIKVYPVSALGGIRYISAIKKPFSHIPMLASQGITIDSIGEYIAQGASAVVVSDAIFNKEAMDQNNMEIIRQLACLASQRGREAVDRLRFQKLEKQR
ncbi:hypothetical protein ACFE04_000248 [Oxalis oulophora]